MKRKQGFETQKDGTVTTQGRQMKIDWRLAFIGFAAGVIAGLIIIALR